MKIVVIGGTGQIGKKLCAILNAQGHETVAAAPSNGVNSITGEGLANAMEGARVVVDVSNAPSWQPADVLAFFQTSTANLLRAEAEAGTVGHHVALSIVGADRIPDSGYMVAKVEQERLIRAGSIPYTIVRATQFFEFLAMIGESGADGSGIIRASSAPFQPIAADDVVEVLADVANSAPANTTMDIAGPEKGPLADFVRRALFARNDKREVIGSPQTPYYGAMLNETSLTPQGEARLGKRRLEDWLH